MVESGPFLEYCCELYIHHYVMNAAIAAVIVFATVLVLCLFAVVLIFACLRRKQLKG